MDYYMIVDSMANSSIGSYLEGINIEMRRNKGNLIEIDLKDLGKLSNITKENSSRPVVLVNGISSIWIQKCISLCEEHYIHALVIAPSKVISHYNISSISFDYAQTTFLFCQYLFKADRKNIAYFAVNPNSFNDIVQKDVFLAFKSEHASTYQRLDEDIFYNNGSLEQCCKELYNKIEKYNSVICANDIAAIKLISYLKKRNISVPENLYVVAIGNSILSETVYPNITIAKYDNILIGRQAVKFYSVLSKSPEISSLSAAILGKIHPGKSTENFECTVLPKTKTPLLKTEEINFFSDIDVSRILSVENLISNCDKLDYSILYGIICGKKIIELADELYTTENTVKYRIKRMCNLAHVDSRKDLISLLAELLIF